MFLKGENMKKIFGLLIALAIMFSFAYPIKTVYAESISDNLIIQLSETHTETELDIRVNLVSNTGVSAITLELDYNKNIFTFNVFVCNLKSALVVQTDCFC